MIQIKLSPSIIDSYLRYCNDLLSLEDLLKRIKGEEEPSIFMECGTAFHEIFENPEKFYDSNQHLYISSKGFKFDADSLALYTEIIPREGLHEVFGIKIFDIPGAQIGVTGKADILLGYDIIELKTTWKPIDFDNYSNSYQWRFYLSIFSQNTPEYWLVDYNVFQLKKSKDDIMSVIDYYNFKFHNYPNLENDLIDILRDFIKFIDKLNLTSYFIGANHGEKRNKKNNQID